MQLSRFPEDWFECNYLTNHSIGAKRACEAGSNEIFDVLVSRCSSQYALHRAKENACSIIAPGRSQCNANLDIP
jgi:hypothetical protein